ncbi:DNA repair protein RecN [Mycetocola spongiae]|uniref:DNA repair protein RecN n=1 Tax=Mycetocola spongiae TaxID=2859226 RepID=UPI001CF1F2E8|nr:DNA repair protein RecN [Mycetocola spongiae]UCR90210.1 DNA repair protein RecN [Mycetocola spongiae]
MIESIDIRDLGVIAQASLPLGPGFTAITGETGAGKTMVVTALGLLLGGRADPAAVRRGASQATVDGRWLIANEGPIIERVRDAGGLLDELDDGRAELTLGRSVSAEGRSRAQVGGRAAPIGVLAELGEKLVVVHGQSDQMRLRSTTAQREALDRFAGEKLRRALATYTAAFDLWRETRETLAMLVDQRDRREAEAERLRLALDEIERVDPQPGEEEELTILAERLTNVEDLRLAAASAREALSSEELGSEPGETDVSALLDHARRQLERAVAFDASLAPIVEQLTGLGYQVAEVVGDLSSYLAALDTDGAHELEQIQERRAILSALVRKHGPGYAEVLELREVGSSRLLELDSDEDRIAELGARVDTEYAAVQAAAAKLTAVRRAAGDKISRAISEELTALAMAQARVSVELGELDDFTAHGRDQVTFLLAPHNGAEPRPLAKGASGGELSRVMLALEVVIASNDPLPTFVFDEVDAGVGGAAAIEIGRRLAKLAASAQVIVVTHLAQVAAFANNHLAVVKADDGSVTASSVRQLRGEERLAEMARLLSGLADSDNALAHAGELLQLASSE